MKKIWKALRPLLLVFVGGLIGVHISLNLHKGCPNLDTKLPAIPLHAGEKMPQFCACKLPSAVLLPVQVYTYGENGKPLPETPQPREAYFIVKHNALWHNQLVFFRWKDETSSPECEE